MNTVDLIFRASGQDLNIANGLHHFASDTVGYVKAYFELEEEWQEFDIVEAIWVNQQARIAMLLSEEDDRYACKVPAEMLSRASKVEINLVGKNYENAELVERLTTYPILAFVIDRKAQVDAPQEDEVSPSLFDQYIEDVIGYVKAVTDMTVSAHVSSEPEVTKTISDDVVNLDFGLVKGDKGDTGATGPEGEAGVDGVGIEQITYNDDYTLSITTTDGETYTSESLRGATGEAGTDGVSPTASVSKSGSVATITITDENGTTTATVEDGTDGQDGQDGYSPSASVSTEDNTTTITITDENGTTTTSFTLSAVATSNDYDDLDNTPTKVSDFANDSGFISSPNVVYCTCSTAGGTAAKNATIVSGSLTELHTGDQAIVKFDIANTVASPTLKVGNTEAKPIKRYGSTAPSTSAKTSWQAGSANLFVYDGTNWQMCDWNNVDTTYSGMTDAEYQAGSSTTNRLISPARLKAAIQYWDAVKDVKVNGSSIVSSKIAALADFEGTDGVDPGTAGLVPAPAASDTGKFLRADGTWASSGGGGGTSDYDDLTDKPQINSVTLSGNKSSSDLSLADAVHTHTISQITDYTDEVFIAQYGVATLAQIKAAADAGKIVVCKRLTGDFVEYYLMTYGDTNLTSNANFELTSETYCMKCSVNASNVWSYAEEQMCPASRTVNGKALTSNITLTAANVSAVPTTRKVNSKALSSDITLTASDVGALPSNTSIPSTADDIEYQYPTSTVFQNVQNVGGALDIVGDYIDDIKSTLIDVFYPVGSYYETSDTSFDPNNSFGGTWVLETEGQVHVSAGTNYAVSGAPTDTNDGGSADAIVPYHRHSVSAVSNAISGGSHSHNQQGWYGLKSASSGTAKECRARTKITTDPSEAGTNIASTHTHDLPAHNTDYEGTSGNATGANMMPYIIVNRWHRTA